jgi:hypothetical protein
MVNICPVCGYQMLYPPTDHHICPSCGTEFGYDDAGTTYEDLRLRWLRNGANWWSPVDQPPPGWNPISQLFLGVYLAEMRKPKTRHDTLHYLGVVIYSSIPNPPEPTKKLTTKPRHRGHLISPVPARRIEQMYNPASLQSQIVPSMR